MSVEGPERRGGGGQSRPSRPPATRPAPARLLLRRGVAAWARVRSPPRAAAGGMAVQRATGRGVRDGAVVEQRVVDHEHQVGRNDPCWCGSGKKFKKCHGA